MRIDAGRSLLGCGSDLSGEFSGVWIGKHDAAAMKRLREGGDPNVGELDDAPAAENRAEKTDWEHYDAVVRMDLGRAHRVRLESSVSDRVIEGQWQITDATPGAVLVEITAPADGAASDSDGENLVRRRFELEPHRKDGKLIGFVLREDGADRRLGALYFQRPGSPGAPNWE